MSALLSLLGALMGLSIVLVISAVRPRRPGSLLGRAPARLAPGAPRLPGRARAGREYPRHPAQRPGAMDARGARGQPGRPGPLSTGMGHPKPARSGVRDTDICALRR